MTTRLEAAVLVLAAGAGTRMRSDTPKFLHTLAGRSMLSHALHAVAKVAPQHLVVVLGDDRERIAPVVGQLAEHLGRPIDIAVQEQPHGTGHAAACGLADLPADFAGTVVVSMVTAAGPAVWASTRPASVSASSSGMSHAVTTTMPSKSSGSADRPHAVA